MKYHPHPSHPGYGWLEPITDADMPLIEEQTALDICAAFKTAIEEEREWLIKRGESSLNGLDETGHWYSAGYAQGIRDFVAAIRARSRA